MKLTKLKISGLLMMAIWLVGLQNAYGRTFEETKQAGDDHLRSGRPTLAVGEYKKALELNPTSTAVCFNLAIAYYKERDLKGTVSTLEKLVQLDPNDYEAYYNLGCLKLYEKNFEAACDYFRKARSCCADQALAPTIEQSLEFVGRLKSLDPQTQDAVLLFLTAQNHR